jgi:ectoine hydroxylase-related dioxygenase (phytanoyl-CoA dioxygenase family)
MNKNQLIHKKNILTKGYTIIKNAIKEEECKKIKEKARNIFKKYSKYYKDANPDENTIYNLHNKDKIFLKYLVDKKIFPIVESILSKGAYRNKDFVILRQSALRNPKFGYTQQLHNDSRISGIKQPLILQVIWLLDDFTKYNGATRIIPGSHRRNDFPKNKKRYNNEKIITGKKGSVIIFDAAVWHGSAKKTVDEDRWGMIFSYSRWFLKPSFDHIQNTPLNIFNNLNKSQKEILGFRFNPPKDEFESISSKSKNFKKPINYKLPK